MFDYLIENLKKNRIQLNSNKLCNFVSGFRPKIRRKSREKKTKKRKAKIKKKKSAVPKFHRSVLVTFIRLRRQVKRARTIASRYPSRCKNSKWTIELE